MINIKTDSRKVKKGDIFVAIKGLKSDGHDHIVDAINNGASKVVVEHGDYQIETIKVENTKDYLIDTLKQKYGSIINEMKLIGVTGTNGKTTSSYLIYQILNQLGIKTAYIGTIGCYLEDKIIELEHTTPDITDLYDLLLRCHNKDIKCVVMEVSSHALEQKRVDGLEFDIAIFTNLTKDHLDFHNTMEEYAKSKRKLFDKLKPNGVAIINADDSYGQYMIPENKTVYTYGMNESDYQIIGYNMSDRVASFRFFAPHCVQDVSSPLLGKHNIYNLLCSIIASEQLGLHLDDIARITKDLKAPKGRMDTIFYGNNRIIVDYAHTPDAIENVIKSVKQFSKGKIYSIIGCGGDRDKSKRSNMADIATRLSDHVIITSDNPRTEDPLSIIEDMTRGLSQENYVVFADRKEAIREGINYLNEFDTLLILGKGHEDYQVIGTTKYHHDDKEYALRVIKKR